MNWYSMYSISILHLIKDNVFEQKYLQHIEIIRYKMRRKKGRLIGDKFRFITLGVTSFGETFVCVVCILTVFDEN